MATGLETPRAGPPRRVIVHTAARHFTLPETPDGTWVGVTDGALTVQATLTMRRSGRPATAAIVTRSPASISTSAAPRSMGCRSRFEPMLGPERRPSDTLAELPDNGWVCLTSVLALDVVDGLEQGGCVGRADRDIRLSRAPAVSAYRPMAASEVGPG